MVRNRKTVPEGAPEGAPEGGKEHPKFSYNPDAGGSSCEWMIRPRNSSQLGQRAQSGLQRPGDQGAERTHTF